MDEDGRPLWRRPALWASLALVLSGAGGGLWASGLFSAPTCSGADVRITVAAQPEMAPALKDVASRFNVERHRVGGRCVHASVTAVAPADYKGQSDAWVPESSLWLDRDTPGTPVATTPVVLSTPRPVADEFDSAGIDISWKLLLDNKTHDLPIARTVADPAAAMTGTVAMLAIRQVDKKADVADDLRKGGGSTATLATLTTAERYNRPLAVTTEQAVVAYNETHQPNPVVSLVPTEGTLMLDHPYAVITKDPRRRDAAEAFQAALGTRSARNILQRAGFRTPDGALNTAYAREYNVPDKAPKALRLPTRKEIEEALTSWKT